MQARSAGQLSSDRLKPTSPSSRRDKATRGLTSHAGRHRPFQILGPGLITGASDDDPSGIATYSQAGAQFGYSLGWTLLLTWPLMSVIQEISARIGRVSGRGLAGVIKRHYAPAVLYVLVALLVIANTINLGADLGAMAASLTLVIGDRSSSTSLSSGWCRSCSRYF